MLPIAKSLTKNDLSKVPTAVHGPLGITNHPTEKAKVIADILETKFISHGLCDENQESRVQASSDSVCRRHLFAKSKTT
jgi:hypothetical protein